MNEEEEYLKEVDEIREEAMYPKVSWVIECRDSSLKDEDADEEELSEDVWETVLHPKASCGLESDCESEEKMIEEELASEPSAFNPYQVQGKVCRVENNDDSWI